MRPIHLSSKIFLDSGDPAETKKAIDVLGFLDGQTTNPTLLVKVPEIGEMKANGQVTRENIFPLYKGIVQNISSLIPDGSVSIEVFADYSTTTDDMLHQAYEMYSWIPNAHIKFPIIPAGLAAAQKFSQDGNRVNMTLCFSQNQAAAVYSSTNGAQRGSTFVSPFIGRLDDIGQNGISVVRNILQMFNNSDHHVEVLAASIRNVNQLMAALALHSDIITIPFSVIDDWAKQGMPVPDEQFSYNTPSLQDIPYKDLNLQLPYTEFDIQHELTTKGVEKFMQDINTLFA